MHDDDKLFAMIVTGVLSVALAGVALSRFDLGGGDSRTPTVRPTAEEAAEARPAARDRRVSDPSVTAAEDARLERPRPRPPAVPAAVADEVRGVEPDGADTDHLLAAVDAIAGGAVPPAVSAMVDGDRDVLVRRTDDGRMVLAAGTFRRYTGLVDRLRGMPVERVAAAVDAAESRRPGIRGRAVRAVAHLLATPDVGDEIEMESRVRYWAFADDRLESLSPIQKHLLRMGPRQAAVVRAVLEELRAELGPAAGDDRGGPLHADRSGPSAPSPDLPAAGADSAAAGP